MTDEVIKNLESNRLTTIEVKIDASEEVDKAIRCWKFIKESIKSKFEKTLLSPNVSLNTEDLECAHIILHWSTIQDSLTIEIIEGRREMVWVFHKNESSKKTLGKWYQIEDELPDWLIEELLLFTE